MSLSESSSQGNLFGDSPDRGGSPRGLLDRAVAAGVPREPGLFINGLFVSGLLPFDEIKALAEEELGHLDPTSNPKN